MRPPAGVASSAMVLTPSGAMRADDVRRGDTLVAMVDGRVCEMRVRNVDRALCCSLMRVRTKGGAVLCAGVDTVFTGGCTTLRPGAGPVEDAIDEVEDLNFCQHVLHWHCGEGASVFAGGAGGAYMAVDASFMERQD